MSPKPRSLAYLYENATLIEAREPFSMRRFLGSFAKFSLAIGAVSSAALGTYQAFVLNDSTSKSAALKPKEKPANERTFFQALIEADRVALKNHDMTPGSALTNMWRGYDSPEDAATLRKSSNSASGHASAQKNGMRAHFRTEANLPQGRAQNSWQLAFFSTTPAPPTPVRLANSASANKAPAPQPAAASTTRQGSRIEAAPQQRGFAETRVAQRSAEQDKQIQPAPRGFTEVHLNTAAPALRPEPDDIAFTHAVLTSAEKDFQSVARARAVTEEFVRRYPSAPETEQFRERARNTQSQHASVIKERSQLEAETPVAPVLFSPEASASIQTCLSGIPELDKLSAINRPVSLSNGPLAYLLSVTVNTQGWPTGEGRQATMDSARKLMPALLGPCLAPLLETGSVALAITDGTDDDLTRKRIDATPGALVYQNSRQRVVPPPTGDDISTGTNKPASQTGINRTR